jgi:hypothetical protein
MRGRAAVRLTHLGIARGKVAVKGDGMRLFRSIGLTLATVLFRAVSAIAQQPVPGQADLKIGEAAPDFTLQASDGQTYSLSKLRGKTVVLAWFPKAFTAG